MHTEFISSTRATVPALCSAYDLQKVNNMYYGVGGTGNALRDNYKANSASIPRWDSPQIHLHPSTLVTLIHK